MENSHQHHSGNSRSREALSVTAAQIQNQVGQWIKNVKSLLESDSLSQAVQFWSAKSGDQSVVDSGISSSGDSCPSLANFTASNCNLSRNGELILAAEMLKNAASADGTHLDYRLPLSSHPYWKKLCKRIRKFEKCLAEQPRFNYTPNVNISTSSTNVSRKSLNRIPIRPAPYSCEQKPKVLEPKPKVVDSKPKYIDPKPKVAEQKPKTVEAKPKVTEMKPTKIIDPKPKPVAYKFKMESSASETRMNTLNDISEDPFKTRLTDSKSKSYSPIYEIESVRMLSTQSTQTPRSRTSSSSSKRERRLKFRARIRVLPSKRSISKRIKGIRCSSPRENQSVTHSGSTATSKKVQTKPSCHYIALSRDRCLSGHQIRLYSHKVRERNRRRHHKSKSRELCQKHSRRSLHSQNSRTGSLCCDIPKTSKTVCKIPSKTKMFNVGNLQKPMDTHIIIRGSPSLKIRSARYRSHISTPKGRTRSSRKRSKPRVSTHRSREPSAIKRKEFHHYGGRNDVRERLRSQSSASKRLRPASGLKFRKHSLRVTPRYVSPGPPPPTPTERSDAEINQVKMKVQSLLQCHQNFRDFGSAGNKTPQAYVSMLSGPTYRAEVESLLCHELKDYCTEESKVKIHEIVRKLLENAEMLYIDDQTSKENVFDNNKNVADTAIMSKSEKAKTAETSARSSDRHEEHSTICSTVENPSHEVIDAASILSDDVSSLKKPEKEVTPVNSLNVSNSDVWATETQKNSEEESLKTEVVYDQRMGEVGAVAEEFGPQSTYSDCFRNPLSETSIESAGQKSSNSDMSTSSSGEIPLERLRAAEIYLDRYISQCPKSYPPMVENPESTDTSHRAHNSEKSTDRATPFLQKAVHNHSPAHRSQGRTVSRSPLSIHRRVAPLPERRPRMQTPPSPPPSAPSAQRARVALPTAPPNSPFTTRDPNQHLQITHPRTRATERPLSRTPQGSAHKSRRNYSAEGRDTKNALGHNSRSRASPTRMPQERGRERESRFGSRATYSPSCERKKTVITPRPSSQTRGRSEFRQIPKYQPSRRNISTVSSERRKLMSFRETPPLSRGRERSHDHEGTHVSRPHTRNSNESSRGTHSGSGYHSSAWEHSSDGGVRPKEESISCVSRGSTRSTRESNRSDLWRPLARKRKASERECCSYTADFTSETPVGPLHQWAPNQINNRSQNPPRFKELDRNIHSASSYYDPCLGYTRYSSSHIPQVHSSQYVTHSNPWNVWKSPTQEPHLRLRGASKPELHSSKWANFAREYYSENSTNNYGLRSRPYYR